jgi:hypothetical protein
MDGSPAGAARPDDGVAGDDADPAVQLVRDARHDLPKGTQLRVDHERGAHEPLFWVADIVAGAVRASHQGRSMYHDLLGDQVEVIEVDC